MRRYVSNICDDFYFSDDGSSESALEEGRAGEEIYLQERPVKKKRDKKRERQEDGEFSSSFAHLSRVSFGITSPVRILSLLSPFPEELL